jgi:hypothetical protein
MPRLNFRIARCDELLLNICPPASRCRPKGAMLSRQGPAPMKDIHNQLRVRNMRAVAERSHSPAARPTCASCG